MSDVFIVDNNTCDIEFVDIIAITDTHIHGLASVLTGAPTDFQQLDAVEGFDGNQSLAVTKHNF